MLRSSWLLPALRKLPFLTFTFWIQFCLRLSVLAGILIAYLSQTNLEKSSSDFTDNVHLQRANHFLHDFPKAGVELGQNRRDRNSKIDILIIK